MLKFLKNSLEDIDDVIVDVATSMKLPEVIVEKDLYVSYILDYLFSRSEFKNYFEFKGGTSLSKGYGLINRFSEDIDVVLKSEVIDENLEEIINLESKSQKEKMAEKLNSKAIEFYKTKLIPSIMNDLKKETNIPLLSRLHNNAGQRHLQLYSYKCWKDTDTLYRGYCTRCRCYGIVSRGWRTSRIRSRVGLLRTILSQRIRSSAESH